MSMFNIVPSFNVIPKIPEKVKLKETLNNYFPLNKSNIVIGENSYLNKVLNGVFNGFVTYNLEMKDTLTKNNIVPLTFNHDYVYFLMPYERLFKFIRKRLNNNHHYFITIHQNMVFVVTDDDKIVSLCNGHTFINDVSFRYFSMGDEILLTNTLKFNYHDITLTSDNMVVINIMYNSFNREFIKSVLNINKDDYEKMQRKFSKETLIIDRQYGGINSELYVCYAFEHEKLGCHFTNFHEKSKPYKNIKVSYNVKT